MDDPIYFSEPFTRAQAWIDLLLLANYADGYFYIRGNRVEVKPGQIGKSKETLAERWQWSRGKVNRFLDELEHDGKIEQQKNRLITLISITNFENLSSAVQQTEQQIEQQIEQQTDTNKKNKNNKNNKKQSSIEDCVFNPPALEEIKDFISENGLLMDGERFFDYYSSNGWVIGKTKMKDWKAAVRNWARMETKYNFQASPKSSTPGNGAAKNVNEYWKNPKGVNPNANDEWS